MNALIERIWNGVSDSDVGEILGFMLLSRTDLEPREGMSWDRTNATEVPRPALAALVLLDNTTTHVVIVAEYDLLRGRFWNPDLFDYDRAGGYASVLPKLDRDELRRIALKYGYLTFHRRIQEEWSRRIASGAPFPNLQELDALAPGVIGGDLEGAIQKVAFLVRSSSASLRYYRDLPDPPGHRAGEHRLVMEEVLAAVERWEELSVQAEQEAMLAMTENERGGS